MSFIAAAMTPLAGIGKPARAAFAKTNDVLKTFLATVFALDEGDGAVKGSEVDASSSFAGEGVVERAERLTKSSDEGWERTFDGTRCCEDKSK